MEFENILKLIDSVSASKLDSFVYEQNGTKIRLEKKKQKIQINGTPDLAMESAAICAEGAVTDTDTGTQKTGKTITSPLVGVFYAAPSEDADPFVKVGDEKRPGCGHRGSDEADERDYQRLRRRCPGGLRGKCGGCGVRSAIVCD